MNTVPKSKRRTLDAIQLTSLRRLRKARRFYKQFPLFAYELMRREYPSYTYEEFLDDLRMRGRSKRVRKAKMSLFSYGRYKRIQELMLNYRVTNDQLYLLQANKLWAKLKNPYILRVRLGAYKYDFHFPARVQLSMIEKLNAECSKCTSEPELNKIVDTFRENIRIW